MLKTLPGCEKERGALDARTDFRFVMLVSVYIDQCNACSRSAAGQYTFLVFISVAHSNRSQLLSP